MIAIKNDSHTGQVFSYSRAESGAHVHGNCLEVRGFSSQYFEKRNDILSGVALNGMQDATGLKVYEDAHIGTAFSDAELVNSQILEILQRGRLIFVLQMRLSKKAILGKGFSRRPLPF